MCIDYFKFKFLELLAFVDTIFVMKLLGVYSTTDS